MELRLGAEMNMVNLVAAMTEREMEQVLEEVVAMLPTGKILGALDSALWDKQKRELVDFFSKAEEGK